MLFQKIQNTYKPILQKPNMIGTVLVTLKVMPESPDLDLETLKAKIIAEIQKGSGKNARFEEQPVAFGLKALITYFMLKEDLPLEPIENAIGKIEGISSTQITDMRRAVG